MADTDNRDIIYKLDCDLNVRAVSPSLRFQIAHRTLHPRAPSIIPTARRAS